MKYLRPPVATLFLATFSSRPDKAWLFGKRPRRIADLLPVCIPAYSLYPSLTYTCTLCRISLIRVAGCPHTNCWPATHTHRYSTLVNSPLLLERPPHPIVDLLDHPPCPCPCHGCSPVRSRLATPTRSLDCSSGFSLFLCCAQIYSSEQQPLFIYFDFELAG